MSKLNWQYNSMSSSGKMLLKSLIYDILTVTMTKKAIHSPVHTIMHLSIFIVILCLIFLLPPLSCSLFCCILSHFPLYLFPYSFFFAVGAKPNCSRRTLWFASHSSPAHCMVPDKEMQRKACVLWKQTHHHWNTPVHSIIYHTLPLVCACMWTCACEYIRAYSSILLYINTN